MALNTYSLSIFLLFRFFTTFMRGNHWCQDESEPIAENKPNSLSNALGLFLSLFLSILPTSKLLQQRSLESHALATSNHTNRRQKRMSAHVIEMVWFKLMVSMTRSYALTPVSTAKERGAPKNIGNQTNLSHITRSKWTWVRTFDTPLKPAAVLKFASLRTARSNLP